MKRTHTVSHVLEAEAGLERLVRLEKELALVPVNSRRHRALSAGIRIEAVAYRKILDIEQASANHDRR